jgi:hypothetical protein
MTKFIVYLCILLMVSLDQSMVLARILWEMLYVGRIWKSVSGSKTYDIFKSSCFGATKSLVPGLI